MSKSKEEFAVTAAHHHTDLNILHAVIAMLEGGTLYTRQGQDAARKVIKICRVESQKQVRHYDNALRKVGVK